MQTFVPRNLMHPSLKFACSLFLIVIIILINSPPSSSTHSATPSTPGCPLSTKCPYYSSLISHSPLPSIDWSNSDCPLKDKCPYFEKLRKAFDENDGVLNDGCPYLSKCPHANEKTAGDVSKCPHFKHGAEGHEDVSKCPHLKKKKEEAAKDEL